MRTILLIATTLLGLSVAAFAQEVKPLNVVVPSFPIFEGDGNTGSQVSNLRASIGRTQRGRVFLVIDYHIYNYSWNKRYDTAIHGVLQGGGVFLPGGAVNWAAGRKGCHYPSGLNPHYEFELSPRFFEQADTIIIRPDTIQGSIGPC
jgi:hypothetical protein